MNNMAGQFKFYYLTLSLSLSREAVSGTSYCQKMDNQDENNKYYTTYKPDHQSMKWSKTLNFLVLYNLETGGKPLHRPKLTVQLV